jgi:hypothetical protein
MTADEHMRQYAVSNAKMIKYTLEELVERFPNFSTNRLMDVAIEIVSASIQCQGNYTS